MALDSMIPDSTIRAYEAAHYDVLAEPRFTLRTGIRSENLAMLYGVYRVASAAFLTTANPLGKRTTDAINARFQEQLLREVTAKSWVFFDGTGRDPLEKWPDEPSLLILGIAREDSMELGARYRQNAIVWCDATAIPHLILLR